MGVVSAEARDSCVVFEIFLNGLSLAKPRAVDRMRAAMIKIFHNPNCGTSRKALGMIRDSGIEPTIVEYLKTPPTREELAELLAAMQMPARSLLRRKEALYSELNLDDPTLSEAQLIDAMVAHPVLIERPIVVTPKGVRLCRPAEKVLEVLSSDG